MNEEKELEVSDSQIYEVGYHLLPNISEENVPQDVSAIHGVISNCGGIIFSEGAPSMRQISYEIAKKVENKTLKFNKAYFGWIKFEVDSSRISEITEKIAGMPNILRFIVIKTVRENTMYTPKAPVFKRENSKEVADSTGDVEKAPVSEEELDKSIEDLVIS